MQQPSWYEREVTATRIVIADDHDLVRMALKAMLQSIAGVSVVGEARTGDELVRMVVDLQPDIAITDLNMPQTDGMEAMARLSGMQLPTRILVVSMHETAEMVQQAVSLGACGYVMKNAPAFELEHAIRAVMATGAYFNSQLAALLLQRPAQNADGGPLTPRQKDVLKRVASGMSAKEIGQDLGLSPKTVDVHRTRLMAKLDLHDIAGLTRYAVRQGIVAA